MYRLPLTLALLASLALPAVAQIIPKDAADPLKVVKGRGEFAKKLEGIVMPTGKDWKSVTDRKKRFQIMVPSKWKLVSEADDGDDLLRIVPPGSEKEVKAALTVMIAVPRDADPLDVDEMLAETYADDLAKIPELARLEFKPTDAGMVVARGMKFALAGGTMVPKKGQVIRQQQLLYVSEDRVVTLQFTAHDAEWTKHQDDVAKIFASYHTLGMIKLAD